MTTLHQLNMTIIDVIGRASRDQNFTNEDRKLVIDSWNIVEEALQNLGHNIRVVFDNRSRSISEMIGSGNSAPETDEPTPEKKDSDA